MLLCAPASPLPDYFRRNSSSATGITQNMVHDSEYLLLQRLQAQASLLCVGRQLGVALAADPG